LAKRKATPAEFVSRYGGVYEHSPWVAADSYEEGANVTDPDRLAEIFARHVDAADRDKKLALIRAHPDLAGKAAVGARHCGRPTDDGLTLASRREQQSAALDQCTHEEYKQFHKLNRRYRERFGFPFIMAVRGSNRDEILKAFEQRLDNDAETEFTTAMQEIHKIARLRLSAMK
jgi:OHCU decarboxylase